MAAIELYPIVCARQRHCSGEMLGAYGPGVEAFQRIDHEIADMLAKLVLRFMGHWLRHSLLRADDFLPIG
jgi:hypothetical protein